MLTLSAPLKFTNEHYIMLSKLTLKIPFDSYVAVGWAYPSKCRNISIYVFYTTSLSKL